MFNAKIISSLDKVLPFSALDEYASFEHAYIYKNSRLSLQILMNEPGQERWYHVRVSADGLPAECFTFRTVEYVYNDIVSFTGCDSEGYIADKPGLMPDVLQPMNYMNETSVFTGKNRCVWVDIDLAKMPKNRMPRKKKDIDISFTLSCQDGVLTLPFTLKFIPAELPAQQTKVTKWFHCDCLASYYGAEVWSERHWEIVENFARKAHEFGQNVILTPVFTPPLDTRIGGERITTQLVRVRLCRNGRYIFNFDLLDRWIDMCDRIGIEFLEISHLFTQWGASHAPKIMADTPDGYRRIFGWETDATGPEYKRFLRRFIPALLAHLKERGDDRRCLFHVSDEPNGSQIKQYKKSRRVISGMLSGYTLMDALSDIKLYKSGAVTSPIPSDNHIQPFIEQYAREGRRDLWTYYCCGQYKDVSNNFIATRGARARFIGTQMWKYGIVGFLQWGFNFYNNQGSYYPVNPMLDASANAWIEGGDAFIVYPAGDGTALETPRLYHFRDALEDIRAMQLCESLAGREKLLAAIESICGEVVFARCVNDTETMLKIREAVDELIADNI